MRRQSTPGAPSANTPIMHRASVHMLMSLTSQATSRGALDDAPLVHISASSPLRPAWASCAGRASRMPGPARNTALTLPSGQAYTSTSIFTMPAKSAPSISRSPPAALPQDSLSLDASSDPLSLEISSGSSSIAF